MTSSPLEVITKYYPAGFLLQLGERFDDVVGFGKPTSRKRRDYENVRVYEVPVQTRTKVLGSYEVLLVDGRVAALNYKGMYPVRKGEIEDIQVRVGPRTFGPQLNAEELGRMDGHNTILFPGIDGNSNFPYFPVEHWVYIDGYPKIGSKAR